MYHLHLHPERRLPRACTSRSCWRSPLYGFHRYVLVYLYLKHRKDVYQPKGKFIALPRITVQLPMYNEDVVAERIIKAILP